MRTTPSYLFSLHIIITSSQIKSETGGWAEHVLGPLRSAKAHHYKQCLPPQLLFARRISRRLATLAHHCKQCLFSYSTSPYSPHLHKFGNLGSQLQTMFAHSAPIMYPDHLMVPFFIMALNSSKSMFPSAFVSMSLIMLLILASSNASLRPSE